jgi:hypothetical protein
MSNRVSALAFHVKSRDFITNFYQNGRRIIRKYQNLLRRLRFFEFALNSIREE